jgi:hypothetical protein
MLKKPTIARPPAKAAPTTPDAFVLAGQQSEMAPEAPKPKDKRLTIDIPPDLHTKFKLSAVAEGTDMKDLMIAFISNYVDKSKGYAQKPGRVKRKAAEEDYALVPMAVDDGEEEDA